MTDSEFYDEPPPIPMTMGPVFVASYESDCPSCNRPIVPGEDIRADGHGSYIHADTLCEKLSRLPDFKGTLKGVGSISGPKPCSDCFCYHSGECS